MNLSTLSPHPQLWTWCTCVTLLLHGLHYHLKLFCDMSNSLNNNTVTDATLSMYGYIVKDIQILESKTFSI